MTAAAGADPANWRTGVGVFCPGTPMANDAGMAVLTGPRDLDKVKRAVAKSGYKGERTVLPVPSDFPVLKALGDVGADMLKRIGINVDPQDSDWGSVLQRLAKTEPVEQGGWSVFHTYWSGLDQFDPAVHVSIRGNGRAASRGWPTSAKLESLRDDWLAATGIEEQKRIAAAILAAGLHRRAVRSARADPAGDGLPAVRAGSAARLRTVLEPAQGLSGAAGRVMLVTWQ